VLIAAPGTAPLPAVAAQDERWAVIFLQDSRSDNSDDTDMPIRVAFHDDPVPFPLSLQPVSNHGKNLLNEDEVESLFAARGFDIIAPETRSLREQIILVANASEIAGVTGSALHLALFNGNPESKLIALDVRSSVNQHIVEQVRGTRAFHMNCVKSRDELGQPQLDCALIWQALKEIL